jgi:hypothetical protein
VAWLPRHRLAPQRLSRLEPITACHWPAEASLGGTHSQLPCTGFHTLRNSRPASPIHLVPPLPRTPRARRRLGSGRALSRPRPSLPPSLPPSSLPLSSSTHGEQQLAPSLGRIRTCFSCVAFLPTATPANTTPRGLMGEERKAALRQSLTNGLYTLTGAYLLGARILAQPANDAMKSGREKSTEQVIRASIPRTFPSSGYSRSTILAFPPATRLARFNRCRATSNLGVSGNLTCASLR